MSIFNIEDYELVDVECGACDSPALDTEGYSTYEQVLEAIRNLPPKPRKVSTRALSVNGQVVHDRMDKYLADPGESSSLLKKAMESPRAYYLDRTRALLEKEGRHFTFGTFAHSAILEPSLFAKVHVMPDADRTTKEGCMSLLHYYGDLIAQTVPVDAITRPIADLRKMIKAMEATAAEEGHEFVKQSDRQIIDVLFGEFNSYGGGILPRLMQYAQTETSMYGDDPATGLRVKIRPDGLLLEENFGLNAVLSVKTTSAKNLRAFMADCAKYRYELAEGMYLDVASEITGRAFTATLMLVVQSVEPYQIALLCWDAEDLAIGKAKYRKAIDTVAKCRAENRWPGFDAEAEDGTFGLLRAKMPKYIVNELKTNSDERP